ncbi:sentrin-specific protease 8 [Drosophila elegans]|uniref:sentrin-specific protease 8 n=1 Tax=Drosophila elegans TaxID=30023 RepID=UPI0007E659EC|nr:sentrin-specific protease 8 [Drosophila elegans]
MPLAKKTIKSKTTSKMQVDPHQVKKPMAQTNTKVKSKTKVKVKVKGKGSPSLAERGSGDGPHQVATQPSLVALHFMDISLRHSDIQLLQSDHEGVNERLVAFYYAHLQHRRYRSQPDLCFLNPALVAQLRHMDMRQLWTMVRDRRLHEKQFILLPLATHPRPHGHWSLLLVSRPDGKFYHYDSIDNCHSMLAYAVSETLRAPLEAWKFVLTTGRCLQQQRQSPSKEGRDRDPSSGIHLMCMTEHVADYVSRCEYATSSLLIAYDQISGMRTYLLELIQSLGGILPPKRSH